MAVLNMIMGQCGFNLKRVFGIMQLVGDDETGYLSIYIYILIINSSMQRNYRVTVVGAGGGIGQPLSMLLKNNPLITDLVLHDVQLVKGVAADISHICTMVPVRAFQGADQLADAVKGADLVVVTAGMARKPGMDREGLFGVNADIIANTASVIGKTNPNALIAIVTNPVNSMVPLAAEVLKKECAYDPKRLFGVTTLDVMRAQTFLGGILCCDPAKVKIPVIGGHAGITIMPILSQCKPCFTADDKCKESVIKRIQYGGEEVVKAKDGKGSATLSMAFAAARFANTLLMGLAGMKTPIEPAYVESNVTCAKFFSTPLSYGTTGIATNLGLPQMNNSEKCALDKAIVELNKSIDQGIKYVDNKK